MAEKEKYRDYIQNNKELLYQTLEELVCISAPSNLEQKRSEYCVSWLVRHTKMTPLQQECGNVILAYPQLEEDRKYLVLMAHLDTVFSEDTKLELRKEDKRWICPGIGDDTANVAVLLLLAKYVFETKRDCAGAKQSCEEGIMFVFDVGEEGLGNLRGSRALIDQFGSYCRRLISFDLYQDKIYTACVGSVRYRLCIATQGGHSYFDFGRENAIAVMAQLIHQIYEEKTGAFDADGLTYNVGVIEGGTSVNTIAHDCTMQFELRSVSAESLKRAITAFRHLLEEAEKTMQESSSIDCVVAGERPCAAGAEEEQIGQMADVCEAAIKEVTGWRPERGAASTDCNYPLSKGIPAICAGLVRGGGAHTPNEWVEPDSLMDGLAIAIHIIEKLWSS